VTIMLNVWQFSETIDPDGHKYTSANIPRCHPNQSVSTCGDPRFDMSRIVVGGKLLLANGGLH